MRLAFSDFSMKDRLEGDESIDRKTHKKTISVVWVTR